MLVSTSLIKGNVQQVCVSNWFFTVISIWSLKSYVESADIATALNALHDNEKGSNIYISSLDSG